MVYGNFYANSFPPSSVSHHIFCDASRWASGNGNTRIGNSADEGVEHNFHMNLYETWIYYDFLPPTAARAPATFRFVWWAPQWDENEKKGKKFKLFLHKRRLWHREGVGDAPENVLWLFQTRVLFLEREQCLGEVKLKTELRHHYQHNAHSMEQRQGLFDAKAARYKKTWRWKCLQVHSCTFAIQHWSRLQCILANDDEKAHFEINIWWFLQLLTWARAISERDECVLRLLMWTNKEEFQCTVYCIRFVTRGHVWWENIGVESSRGFVHQQSSVERNEGEDFYVRWAHSLGVEALAGKFFFQSFCYAFKFLSSSCAELL